MMKQTTTPRRRTPGLKAALLTTASIMAVLGCRGAALAQNSPTGPAGGDLSGTYPNPTFAADRVRKTGDTMTGALNINVPNTGNIPVPFTIQSSGNALLNRGTAMGFYVPQSGANQLGGQITTAWGSLAQTYMAFSAYNNGSFSEIFRMDGRGYFGIGTNNPTSKLHVVSGTDSGTTLLSLDTGVHGGTSMAVFGTANNESGFDMSVFRAGQYHSRFGVTAAAGHVYLQPGMAGNVGIGTSTPGYRLDVQNGQVNASGGLCIAGDCKVSWAQVAGGSGGTQWTTSGTNIFYNSGSVGVGTATPNAAFKLDVSGQVRSSVGGFVFPDGTVQATASAGTVTGVTAGAGLTGGGTGGALTLNVGAGTGLTVAADSLSVNYGSAAGTAVQGNTTFTVTAGSGMTGGGQVTLGSGGSVTLTNNDKGSSQNIFKSVANAAGAVQFSAGSNNDAIRFEGTGGTTVSFDSQAKKVTIGSTASGSTLAAANVSAGQFGANTGGGAFSFPGDVTVAGNIAAKFQDVAEWAPSTQKLSAGTVVVIDTVRTNHVVASGRAYDTGVAGVVSAQPGVILGVAGEGKVMVATTGRVKVRVDATRGRVRVGDLLVTSDVEGLAMRSVPVRLGGARMHRPGTIIGKALEPLEGGVGEILVLLSLQ